MEIVQLVIVCQNNLKFPSKGEKAHNLHPINSTSSVYPTECLMFSKGDMLESLFYLIFIPILKDQKKGEILNVTQR